MLGLLKPLVGAFGCSNGGGEVPIFEVLPDVPKGGFEVLIIESLREFQMYTM